MIDPKFVKYKTPDHKTLILRKKRDKTQGKNRNPYDGFYSIAKTYGRGDDYTNFLEDIEEIKEKEQKEERAKEEKKIKYFVKCPEGDKGRIEFFTEFFAGQLCNAVITKFFSNEKNNHNLKNIQKDTYNYKKCFICADWGETVPEKNTDLEEEQSSKYALVQPFVAEKRDLFSMFGPQVEISDIELYDLYDADNRNAFIDYFFSGSQYRALARYILDHRHRKSQVDTLNFILMFSTAFLGDYSVHSANIFHYRPGRFNIFARFDLGAAWRNYAKPGNSTNILIPQEYRYLGLYKKSIKNYLRYYITLIPGCLEGMRHWAKEFNKFLKGNHDVLEGIIANIINDIPENMFTDLEIEKISKYIGMPSFKREMFIRDNENRGEQIEEFATALTNTIKERIGKLAEIKVPGLLSRILHPKRHPWPWFIYLACLGTSIYLFYSHADIAVLSILTLMLVAITISGILNLVSLLLPIKQKKVFYLLKAIFFMSILLSLILPIYYLILPIYAQFFNTNSIQHAQLLLFLSSAFCLFFVFEMFIHVLEYKNFKHPRFYGNLFRLVSALALLGIGKYYLYNVSTHELTISSWQFAGYFFLAAVIGIISYQWFTMPLREDIQLYWLSKLGSFNAGHLGGLTSGDTPGENKLEIFNSENVHKKPFNEKSSLLSFA